MARSCEAGQLPLTSLSPPALIPSSIRTESSTWTKPWMSPGMWRSSYAAPWTVWTPASPHLLVFSPLPEAHFLECLSPTLFFGNSPQWEGVIVVVILVLLCVLAPLQVARVCAAQVRLPRFCHSGYVAAAASCCLFLQIKAFQEPMGLLLLQKRQSFCCCKYSVQAGLFLPGPLPAQQLLNEIIQEGREMGNLSQLQFYS